MLVLIALLQIGLSSAPGSSAPPPPAGLQTLIEAYPDFLERGERTGSGAGEGAESGAESASSTATAATTASTEAPGDVGQWQLVWKDGTRMPWDDAKPKTHEEKLSDADLEDMMSQTYPAGAVPAGPAVDDDPGRIRNEAFFRKMYGSSPREVEGRLGPVRWVEGCQRTRLRATTVNGVNRKLEAVARDIEKLPEESRKLACDLSGPYTWRKVRKTDRLSTHSFGIAIDVALARADFWRWNKPDVDGRRAWKSRVPSDLVEAFERHGFLWGGRWYHFDTMHFEYRPELCPTAGTRL